MRKQSESLIFLIFLISVLYLIYVIYVMFRETYETYGEKIKFLNLVLFSPGKEYEQMYELTRRFYLQFSNVDTIYYVYDENIDSEYNYDQEKNLLRIRGKETYLPGILEKTIKTFHFVPTLGKQYDYIIRSNISTLVDFNKLSDVLTTTKIHYGGGLTMTLSKEWRDPNCGIHDDRYQGVTYASGTCMMFSNELFQKMLSMTDRIDYNVIDDVSIGQFIMKEFPDYTLKGFESLFCSTDWVRDEKGLEELSKKYVFFRNRHTDRREDIKKMDYLVNKIKW